VAPVFDAGRRAFPIFVKANKLDAAKIQWTAMDPPLRETMLVKGDVDAITGFYFTSLLNLNARGVKDADVDVLMYPKHGVNLYGNAIIVSEQFLKEKPEAVKAFLRAFTKGMKDVLADPDGSIKYVKERDALIDEALEKRRMKLALDSVVITPEAKANGLGDVTSARLSDMVTQVSQAFEIKNPVKPRRSGAGRTCRRSRSGWYFRNRDVPHDKAWHLFLKHFEMGTSLFRFLRPSSSFATSRSPTTGSPASPSRTFRCRSRRVSSSRSWGRRVAASRRS
jgi:hypothetical protein